MTKYKAYVVSDLDGKFEGRIEEKELFELSEGDVDVRVQYSSLNFKDALSNAGNKGVTRSYPHTPGIDAVGIVERSNSKEFNVGDTVLVTGYDLGMNTNGGFGERICVPDHWLIQLPKGLKAIEAMAWGTAGLTAALCVKAISEKVPKGKVLVSGSTGGVGSIAIMLLAKLGYEVVALTRKAQLSDQLKSLGASEVIDLQEFLGQPSKPILKPIYHAAIDVAGGETLATMLKQIDYQGVVACCGLVDSPTFESSIFPFILRGVTLRGIDSVELPVSEKESIWLNIAGDWSLPSLLDHCSVINKEQLSEKLKLILEGKAVGRYILEHDSEG